MNNRDSPNQDLHQIVIIKIGGSVFSDKKTPFSLRTETLDQIIHQIQFLYNQLHLRFIIVHGGGSYGHPLAKQYSLHLGKQEIEDQILGLAKTHFAMHELNGLIVNKFLEQKVPVIPIQASACFFFQSDGEVIFTGGPQIQTALQLDLIPILYGDVLFHSNQNFSIISGDQIIVELFKAIAQLTTFSIQKVIFCIDREGILTKNQKTGKYSLIHYLKFGELDNLTLFDDNDIIDVTGSLAGKLAQIKRLAEFNIQVQILNGLRPDYLLKAVLNDSVPSTIIEE